MRALRRQGLSKLVAEGAIGKVIQTLGVGPHRLQLPTRPDWFFDPEAFGGIIVDIASHQVDQFLFYTGSTTGEVIASSIGNFGMPDKPAFEDFGEVLLRSDKAAGYVRVDWFTPEALPTWGDGRLTILGTEGYIELRKYIDIAYLAGQGSPLPGQRQGNDPYRLQRRKARLFRRFHRRRWQPHADGDDPGSRF